MTDDLPPLPVALPTEDRDALRAEDYLRTERNVFYRKWSAAEADARKMQELLAEAQQVIHHAGQFLKRHPAEVKTLDPFVEETEEMWVKIQDALDALGQKGNAKDAARAEEHSYNYPPMHHLLLGRAEAVEADARKMRELLALLKELIAVWINGRKIHDGMPLPLRERIDSVLKERSGLQRPDVVL